MDVVGNVWEWASDWYAPYTAGAQVDPTGGTGTDRVLRGGAWNGGDPAWVRPTYRFKSPPTLRSHGIGFRCVQGPHGITVSSRTARRFGPSIDASNTTS